MEELVQLGGIAFDPHIRGALVAMTGVVVLCGSVYLVLATDVGARLGFLLAAGALAGWMAILGVTWWITPPAIGPRGDTPSWEVVDVVGGSPQNASEEVLLDLPNGCWSSVSSGCESVNGGTLSAEILAANPDLEEEFGEDATISELLSGDPEGLDEVDFGEWELVTAAEAGEAVSAAEEHLTVVEELFDGEATLPEYIVLDGWEQGGKEPLPEDPNRLDRIWYKIRTSVQLTHPTHYAVVQVQPTIPQRTVPGEPPPTPIADPDAPVITVLMVRNLGNLRVPGMLVTVASALMLGVIAYALHRRDKLADEHRASVED